MDKKWQNLDKYRERIRLWAVLCFFLISGCFYSHSAAEGELSLGRKVTIEELEQPVETIAVQERAGKININTAEAEELMLLDGIGEKLAARIIEERTENGAFSGIEDIQRVSGIGEKTFAKIQEEITVEE